MDHSVDLSIPDVKEVFKKEWAEAIQKLIYNVTAQQITKKNKICQHRMWLASLKTGDWLNCKSSSQGHCIHYLFGFNKVGGQKFAFRVQSLTLILDTCIHVRAINQTTCQRQICTHRFLSFLFCGELSKPLWQLYRKLALTLLTLPPVTCEQPVQQKKSLSVLLSYVAYASHPSTSLAKCRQSILQLCCPTGILPCEIRLAFYGESQLR